MQEMQSINKIHINNSTEMSLNDRFTIMQKSIGSTNNEPRRRIRMRSSSKSRILNQPASTPNRRLLEQLDKKHKMRAALKLKRVNDIFQPLNKNKKINKTVKLASNIK